MGESRRSNPVNSDTEKMGYVPIYDLLDGIIVALCGTGRCTRKQPPSTIGNDLVQRHDRLVKKLRQLAKRHKVYSKRELMRPGRAHEICVPPQVCQSLAVSPSKDLEMIRTARLWQ